MKKLLFILSFIVTLSSQAQFTQIPDVNFENALIALNIDSGTPDHQVLTANINKLTSLSVPNKNITDLTGIQDFVALKTLDCSN
jgi:Leucine-rich repeat (LRR) protein